jgi:outer membrane biosynthesis protein TonB
MNMQRDNDDKALDDYLQGTSSFSKAYAKSKDLKSPAHLNERILQMARESIEADTPHHGSSNHWKWPLAMAATFLLVIAGTVTLVLQRTTEPAPQIATETTTQQAPVTQTEQTTQMQETPPMQQTEVVEQTPVIAPVPQNSPVPQNKKPQTEKLAIQQEETVPEHLRELVQPASAGGSGDNLPPDEVLKSWTRDQWIEQVKSLRAQKRAELADKYIAAYPRFFPDENLADLIRK